MALKYIHLLFFSFLFSCFWSQDLIKKYEKGKKITIEMWPIGDAWTDPKDYHLISLYSINGKNLLEIKKDTIDKKLIISFDEVTTILRHYEEEYEQKSSILNQGLSYDIVKIKAGRKKYKFRTVQYNDHKILKDYIQLQ